MEELEEMSNQQQQSHWSVLNAGKIVVSDSPQSLWEKAVEYFKWCDANPIIRKITLSAGKNAGKRVNEEFQRPYTIKALCIHCGILEEYLRDIRQSKDESSDYYNVVTKILYIIYTQNAELAIVGIYNPIFTAKLLNIEKDEVPTKSARVEIINSKYGERGLANSETEVLEKLESESLIIKNQD